MSSAKDLSHQWDSSVDSWTDFVRAGKDFYRDEMNNPAFFKLLGNVKDKKTLDLACGEGSNTRILARIGAKVVGTDFSEKMIEYARQVEEREKLGIRYIVADAADLKKLSNDSFELVTCFMALMDIEKYQKAIAEVARVLRKDGRFVFSITHPCFEWGGTTGDGRPVPGDWKYKEGKSTGREPSHYEITDYFHKIKVSVPWQMKRLTKHFETTSFHRTLTDYSQAMYGAGLLMQRLVEPKPSRTGASKYPQLRKHRKIPHAIIIEAVKK
jgi:ubiquinone/menaquinone biosynthesis C-methylase UbiE